jgi:hypothetical protein
MLRMALDLLSIVLLSVTAFWCVRVHRRLVALRSDRAEIAAFVESLATATARAERIVQEMKAASGEAAVAREAQESAARDRREELDRTVEAAQKMARRLEDALGQGARLVAELRARQDAQALRTTAQPEPPPAPTPAAAEPAAAPAPPRRRVRDDLLEALQKLR